MIRTVSLAGDSPSRASTSRAGPSSSSPAAEPKPPPITTSPGSKTFTKLTIPVPSRHPISASASTAARAPLADRRSIGVVVDPDREAVPLAHAVAEVDACKRDVHGRDRAAGLLVDSRRDPEAERGDIMAGAELLDDRVQAREHRVLGGDVRRVDELLLDLALAAHDRGQRLRPTDIHPDDPQRLHARWLPYAAGWRRPVERSRIASTVAAASRAGCPRWPRPSVSARRARTVTASAVTAAPARSRPRARPARSAGDASSGSRSCWWSCASSSGA